MNKQEKRILNLIREEYNNQLLRLFRESVASIYEGDVTDVEGNVLLSPGLKVRHKSSGYEYTVDHVEGSGESVVIYLRHPEAPRFKPPEATTSITEGEEPEEQRVNLDQVDLQKVMGSGGVDDELSRQASGDPMELAKKSSSGSLLKVSAKDFEKEYEVK